jgi:hypothetical protein
MFYIYCISSQISRSHTLRKLGLTTYPPHRLRVLRTGDLPLHEHLKEYEGIWEVDAKTVRGLYAIEARLHRFFKDKWKVLDGCGPKEWFVVSFEEVVLYMESQKITLKRLELSDIEEIHQTAKRPPKRSEIKLCQEEQNAAGVLSESLKERFFHTFLGSKPPRRIQDELWDIFEEIVASGSVDIYKGIVQWPTGVGKTIAILAIIVLIKEHCESMGTLYRGLMVSPKNDIFATIMPNFAALAAEFGITLIDGSHGQLSRLSIPTDCHILILACPASLLRPETGMDALPRITHVHYDEVHRITGELYFQSLKVMLEKWNTKFLTGTSATPKTSSVEQHRKLAELFGEDLPTIHKCDIDEAVSEGWIAAPRFLINITPKCESGDYSRPFVSALTSAIEKKSGKGNKYIAFVPSSLEDAKAVHTRAAALNTLGVYSALDRDRTDDKFIEAPIDEAGHLLVTCQRYREGSDIKGVELVAVLIGSSISAYILLQIQGRSLRLDYPGKEGWCLIVSPHEEGESYQDVWDRIALEIIDYLGSKTLKTKDIVKYVDTYFSSVVLDGVTISREETINRLQAAYLRREYVKKTPKEKYDAIRDLNTNMGLKNKQQYEASRSRHTNYIESPEVYFREQWTCWYDFLGIDISRFPLRKADWIQRCKDEGFWKKSYSQSKYNEKCEALNLPSEPMQLYSDYSNWDKEMGVEEEHVW